MEHFSAWVTWHGPFYTKEAWVVAADSLKCHDTKDCFRLYMALGCANTLSLNDPRIQYVGLNARDSDLPLAGEIRNKFVDCDKRFNGLFNEYWVGELLTQFADCDTSSEGVTRDTEHSIIFALNPMQNYKDYKNAPAFSFRVINELSNSAKTSSLFPTQFEDLVPSFIEYDSHTQTLAHGKFRLVRRKRMQVDKLDRPNPETKKLAVLYWWERLAYEIVADFNQLRAWAASLVTPQGASDKRTYSGQRIQESENQ